MLPRPYKVAAIQMTSVPDVAVNLNAAGELIARAAAGGAELAGLPEVFAFLGPEQEMKDQAAHIAKAGREFLIDTARKHDIALIGGIIELAADGRIFNTALFVDKDGTEVARYRKMHLFDVNIPDGVTYRESGTVAPGDAAVVAASPDFGDVGLSICYDVRFPELYRALSANNAALIFIPAAFTAYTGRAHWDLLVRSRAVENTSYVVAPAQCGNHYGKRESFGHAMIVDPWGEVLADAGEEPGVISATVDPARLREVRERMPSLKHRRL